MSWRWWTRRPNDAATGTLPLGPGKQESSDMRTHRNPGSRRDQGVSAMQTGRRSTRGRLCDQPTQHVGERKLCDARPMSAYRVEFGRSGAAWRTTEIDPDPDIARDKVRLRSKPGARACGANVTAGIRPWPQSPDFRPWPRCPPSKGSGPRSQPLNYRLFI